MLNICELYDPYAYIRTTYTYSPYGAVTTAGDVEQPIQWSSEFHDTELGLVYYNYRHYNPRNGRWLTRDILDGVVQLYCYLSNMVFKIDIKGLNPDTPPPPSKSSTLVEEVRKLAQRHGLTWVTRAVGEIGVKEEPNRCCKRISEYADAIPNKWTRDYMKSDRRPWCACFVYWCISDIKGTKPSDGKVIQAQAYETCWEASEMLFGAMAVTRNRSQDSKKYQYHVTFVVGVSPDQKEIYCLGGNQSRQVKITKYKASTVTAYRFPKSAGYQQLPPIIVKGANDISSNDSTR